MSTDNIDMDTLTAMLNSRDGKKLKPDTIKGYCNSINNICQRWENYGITKGRKGMGFKTQDGKTYFRFDKLAKTKEVFDLLSKTKEGKPMTPSAVKNKVSALITVLKVIDPVKYAKAIEVYHQKQEELRGTIKTNYNQSKRSEKQDANWTTLKQLQDCIPIWEAKFNEMKE